MRLIPSPFDTTFSVFHLIGISDTVMYLVYLFGELRVSLVKLVFVL